MPEADYAYQLTPAQRTFGDWIGHTVQLNQRVCAQLKGEQPPAAHSAAAVPKAHLVEMLKASFAACDATLPSFAGEAALKEITVGGRQTTPLALMVAFVAQLNSHYGNLVGYLRTRNITPPSTARSAKK
jgi:hypothetical protein